jgi:hypothetical protein
VVFSNISAFGPSSSASAPPKLRDKHAEGSAMRLRRNTRLQVYNSIFAGWGNGFRVESDGSYNAAQHDSLTVQYCMIAGVRGSYFKESTAASLGDVRNWYMDADRHNDTLAANTDLMITDPFNYAARNFQPMVSSPVLTASYWYSGPTAVREVKRTVSNTIIYPNPVSRFATVKFDNPSGKNFSFVVYNLTGQSVMVIHDITGSEFTFERGNLPAGVYIYQLKNANESHTGKIIIR